MTMVMNHVTLCCFQVNLTFEDYLKTFYPYQTESVFTNNNWTLSEVVIYIFQSNEFYQQHVRWNIHRFGPFETAANTPGAAGIEGDSCMENRIDQRTQPHLSKLANTNEETDIDEAEDSHPSSAPTRSKRKADPFEHFHAHDTRTQSRKLRKQWYFSLLEPMERWEDFSYKLFRRRL